jgi:MoaA/NifB/PqqE/SkfB family radical SAM enzyme
LAFTVTADNAAEVEQCAELAARVGASTAVFRPLYPVGVARRNLDLMPTFEQYSAALGRLSSGYDTRQIDPFSPASRAEGQAITHANPGCGAGNLVCSISVSGQINPCSFLGPHFDAGNVAEQSLAELWHDSAGFREMRDRPGGGEFAGGCRARALVLNGSVDAPDPWVTAPGPRRLLPLLTVDVQR